jgi:hypothetical protein
MKEIHFEADDLEDVVGLLIAFIDDIYGYLGLELPEDLDPEQELVRIVQAIKDKQNAKAS